MHAVLPYLPLILWTGAVAGMMGVMLAFDRMRGTALKDRLAGFWPPDRRRVLHLSKQNGFHFFVARIIGWSAAAVRFSWIAALPAVAGGFRGVLVAAFLISLGVVIRSACLVHLAAARVRRFTLPPDYDGFGAYARTAEDWRRLGAEMRPRLTFGILSAGVFALGAIGSVP